MISQIYQLYFLFSRIVVLLYKLYRDRFLILIVKVMKRMKQQLHYYTGVNKQNSHSQFA